MWIRKIRTRRKKGLGQIWTRKKWEGKSPSRVVWWRHTWRRPCSSSSCPSRRPAGWRSGPACSSFPPGLGWPGSGSHTACNIMALEGHYQQGERLIQAWGRRDPVPGSADPTPGSAGSRSGVSRIQVRGQPDPGLGSAGSRSGVSRIQVPGQPDPGQGSAGSRFRVSRIQVRNQQDPTPGSGGSEKFSIYDIPSFRLLPYPFFSKLRHNSFVT